MRIRLPGGKLTAAQLSALTSAAIDFGNATLELTSRGSVQLRGIENTAAVADALAASGLLPSPTHERVRNIVASPLSGRAGGLFDVRSWVDDLDAALQNSAALADLPGRFWFSIDDGRGDVSGLRADAGVQVHGDGAVALQLAGVDSGVRLSCGAAVGALVSVAERFQNVRGKAWRVSELADPTILIDDFEVSVTPGDVLPPLTRPPVGWIEQRDGRIALGAAVPLGVLPARTAEFLAVIEAPLVITPWRSLLVCDLEESAADTCLRVLPPLGLVFDENSPWLEVSACTGSPGCANSAADVRADAAAAAERGELSASHTHFVGCERACGSPLAGDVLVATPEGYQRRERHP